MMKIRLFLSNCFGKDDMRDVIMKISKEIERVSFDGNEIISTGFIFTEERENECPTDDEKTSLIVSYFGNLDSFLKAANVSVSEVQKERMERALRKYFLENSTNLNLAKAYMVSIVQLYRESSHTLGNRKELSPYKTLLGKDLRELRNNIAHTHHGKYGLEQIAELIVKIHVETKPSAKASSSTSTTEHLGRGGPLSGGTHQTRGKPKGRAYNPDIHGESSSAPRPGRARNK